MINAGEEFKNGFTELLKTFGGDVVIHKNWKCDNMELIRKKGMKNRDKNDSSKIMFQFPNKFEVGIGDVIQQGNSDDY